MPETDLIKYVGDRIRALRTGYAAGQGLSQDSLAKEVGVATNTISRWETGTYKPSLQDLEKLSRFFGVSIMDFLPEEEVGADRRITALLRTARELDPADLEELQRYAEFRQARSRMAGGGVTRGRKRKEA
jgi:transcriptional regulator with XRE-family HTH domain